MSIRALPEDVRNKIRSGIAINSVWQCVEELVQNAIDAKSTCVAVRLDLQFFKIQVVDNGQGISYADLKVLGERYWTSKCFSLSDLERARYYGYRGEALASIRDVSSDVTVVSELLNGDSTHVKTMARGSSSSSSQSSGVNLTTRRSSHGTTVTVWGFLHNLPVRRASVDPVLDTERARRSLEALALVHPHISFSLHDNGSDTWCLTVPKTGSVPRTFGHIFGSSWVSRLKWFTSSSGQYTVSGYLATRGHRNRSFQFIYVHRRRLVGHRLQRAISEMLEKRNITGVLQRSPVDTLPPNYIRSPDKYQTSTRPTSGTGDLFPVFVLEIECPRKFYDVGLHPTKTVIEFRNYEQLLELAKRLVSNFLNSIGYGGDVCEAEPVSKQSHSFAGSLENVQDGAEYQSRDISVQNVKHSLHSLAVKRPYRPTNPVDNPGESSDHDRGATRSKRPAIVHSSTAQSTGAPRETTTQQREVQPNSTSKVGDGKRLSVGVARKSGGVQAGATIDKFTRVLEWCCDQNDIVEKNQIGAPVTSLANRVERESRSSSISLVPSATRQIRLTAAMYGDGKTALGKLAGHKSRSERIRNALDDLKKLSFIRPTRVKAIAPAEPFDSNNKRGTCPAIVDRVPRDERTREEEEPSKRNFRDAATSPIVPSKYPGDSVANDSTTITNIVATTGHVNDNRHCRHRDVATTPFASNGLPSVDEANFYSRINGDFRGPPTNASHHHHTATSSTTPGITNRLESNTSGITNRLESCSDRVPVVSGNELASTTVRQQLNRGLQLAGIASSRSAATSSNGGSRIADDMGRSSSREFTRVLAVSKAAEVVRPRLRPASMITTRDMIYGVEHVTRQSAAYLLGLGVERVGDVPQLSSRIEQRQTPRFVEEVLLDASPNPRGPSAGAETRFTGLLSKPKPPIERPSETQPFQLINETQPFICTINEISRENGCLVNHSPVIAAHGHSNGVSGISTRNESREDRIADSRESICSLANRSESPEKPANTSDKSVDGIGNLDEVANASDVNVQPGKSPLQLVSVASSLNVGETRTPNSNGNETPSCRLEFAIDSKFSEKDKTPTHITTSNPPEVSENFTDTLEVVPESSNMESDDCGAESKGNSSSAERIVSVTSESRERSIGESCSDAPVESSSSASNIISSWISVNEGDGLRKVFIDKISGNSYFENPEKAVVDSAIVTVDSALPDKLAIAEGEIPLSASCLPTRPWRSRTDTSQQNTVTTLTTRPQTQNPEVEVISRMLKTWNNPVFRSDQCEPTCEISCQTGKLLSTRYKRPYVFDKSIFRDIRVISQVENKFIACLVHYHHPECTSDENSDPNVLVLFDQHAVHERIRLEELLQDACPGNNGFVRLRSAALNPPLSLTLPSGLVRVALARNSNEQFVKCGLLLSETSPADSSELLVHAAPECLVDRDRRELKMNRPSVIAGMIESLIWDLVEEIEVNGSIGSIMPKVILNTLKSYACKAAIKFGDVLTVGECTNLIVALKGCKLPFHCAHGRPSIAPLADLQELKFMETERETPKMSFKRLKTSIQRVQNSSN